MTTRTIERLGEQRVTCLEFARTQTFEELGAVTMKREPASGEFLTSAA
jgi:hypothetical protein